MERKHVISLEIIRLLNNNKHTSPTNWTATTHYSLWKYLSYYLNHLCYSSFHFSDSLRCPKHFFKDRRIALHHSPLMVSWNSSFINIGRLSQYIFLSLSFSLSLLIYIIIIIVISADFPDSLSLPPSLSLSLSLPLSLPICPDHLRSGQGFPKNIHIYIYIFLTFER